MKKALLGSYGIAKWSLDDSAKEEPGTNALSVHFEKQVTDLINSIISAQGSLPDPLHIEGNRLLFGLVADIPRFTDQWGIDSYQKLISLVLYFWLHDTQDNHEIRALQAEVLKELERRQHNDKIRVENRPDQMDKRAFQEAVEANQEDYLTISEAIRDLREKPQFEKYRVATLRNWTREVWTKPKKIGRPKKIIN